MSTYYALWYVYWVPACQLAPCWAPVVAILLHVCCLLDAYFCACLVLVLCQLDTHQLIIRCPQESYQKPNNCSSGMIQMPIKWVSDAKPMSIKIFWDVHELPTKCTSDAHEMQIKCPSDACQMSNISQSVTISYQISWHCTLSCRVIAAFVTPTHKP